MIFVSISVSIRSMDACGIWMGWSFNRANPICILQRKLILTTVGLLATMIFINHMHYVLTLFLYCFFFFIFHTTPVGHTWQNESKNSSKPPLIEKPNGIILDTYTIDVIEALLCELSYVYSENRVPLLLISIENYKKFE